MPKTVLRAGGMVEIPNLAEISAAVEAGIMPRFTELRERTSEQIAGLAATVDVHLSAIEQAERDRARAVKWLRFPRLRGTPASSAISLGVAKGQVIGPEPGYLWSVRRLVISGLTASSTSPDIVNFYYTDNTVSGPPWWQLNGNSFGTEFDMGGMMMRGGETLNAASVGSIAATGTIIVDWDGWEVPEEMAWKLIAGG